MKYTIKKIKTAKDGNTTFYKEVGTLIINEGEGTGVMYLHLLDGEFRLFSEEFYSQKKEEVNHA